jgi:uncharacterized protein YecT (DUF1311 family)
MRNDDFTTDLSELDTDYQVLTELHRTSDSRSYLARHLKLNRDVTITVIRAGADRKLLGRFDADVTRLKSLRHPNVIPVLEGRWLRDGSYAVVRARVRGSSLDQLVSAVGPLPLPRIASSLDQVRSALEWARTNGVASRHVAQDAMIFQQGSGRVLLALDPTMGTIGSIEETCDDVRTVGALAWEMLSGLRLSEMGSKPLGTVRPDLSPRVIAETESLLRCERGKTRDIAQYIALLSAAGASTAPASVAPPSEPRVIVAPPTPLYSTPVGAAGSASAVVTKQGGMGFNARLAVAVAIVAMIAVVALLFMNRGRHDIVDRTAVNGESMPTGEAAGDVALRARPDTAVPMSSVSSYPQPVAELPVGQQPVERSPAAAMPAPPETRRHEPPRVPQQTSLKVPRGTSGDSANLSDACSSIAPSDQHRCLMAAIDRNDVELNGVYRSLVSALRRQAGLSSDDPDPDAVDRLRSAQRKWVDDRDAACRDFGSGALYARDRAQCFADQSAARARALREQLQAIPDGR